MPLYEVQHIGLSEDQQDRLAEGITKIHTRLFVTPANFVHVQFASSSTAAYMAGKRRQSNLIKANVRFGPDRPQESYTHLCTKLSHLWSEVTNDSKADQDKLRAIFVLGDIVAAWENGFQLPAAGGDVSWISTHLHEMRTAAKNDPDIQDMLTELHGREEFKEVLAKNAVNNGWLDYASNVQPL